MNYQQTKYGKETKHIYMIDGDFRVLSISQFNTQLTHEQQQTSVKIDCTGLDDNQLSQVLNELNGHISNYNI